MHGFSCDCPTCHDLRVKAREDSLAGHEAWDLLLQTHRHATNTEIKRDADIRASGRALLARLALPVPITVNN